MTDRELLALAAQLERRIGKDLLEALLRIRAGIRLSEVEAALVARDLDAATALLGREQVAAALWDAQLASQPVREAAFRAALLHVPARYHLRQVVETSLGQHLQLRPSVAEALRQLALARIEGMTAQTTTALREQLREGLTQGTPIPELARQLRAVVGLNARQAASVRRYRAARIAEGREADQIERMTDRFARGRLKDRTENIARSETMMALNEGKRLLWTRMAEAGEIQSADWIRVWVTAPENATGGGPCPVCEPYQGATAPIGGTFTSREGEISPGPPRHPRCVLGDTRITAAPRLRAQAGRAYEGEIVRVRTKGGKALACTPNHPVLTDGGWVAAGELEQGDHLVCHRPLEGMGRADDHREGMPPRIEEIAKSWGETRGVASVEVPVAPPDFHGDGKGSEVAVVRSHLLLGDGGHPESGQPALQPPLVEGGVGLRALLALGLGDLLVEGERHAAHCVVCGGDLPPALAGRHAAPLESLGLALSPAGDARLVQSVVDHQPGHAQGGGDPIDGLARLVPADDRSHVELETRGLPPSPAAFDARLGESMQDGGGRHAEGLSDAVQGPPFLVELDRVVEVERGAWRGHVYNLETEEGWYAANGIITHNCRCIEILRLAALHRARQAAAS